MAAQPQQSPSASPARSSSDAQHQAFTGATVEEVLADVRRTFGANAEIVEANKVRSGGIGGFFAKESVEVVARRRTPSSAADPGLPAGIDEAAFDRASALLAKADQVSAAEQAVSQDHPQVQPSRHGQQAVSQHQPQVQPSRHAQQAVSQHQPQVQPSRHGQAGAVPFEPMSTAEMPRLSTQGGAFNDVLQRIAADAGEEIASAVDRRLAMPGQNPPQPMQGQNPPQPMQGQSAQQPQSRAEVGLRPVGPQARSRADQARQAHSAPPHAEVAPVPTPSNQVPHPATSQPPAQPEPREHDVEVEPAREEMTRTERLMSWLERDNLPRSTVITALRGLPTMPALPDSTGVVVAVVGRRQDALKLCRQLAKAHDADPGQVVLASAGYKGKSIPSERRIIDVTDAQRERKAWRRRDLPTFVAVEAPTSVKPDTLQWTREIVAELEVHQVVGIVSAARKVSDIGMWAQEIGGVDGFALIDLDQTATPHEVLALEVPIAYLEDQQATPGAWAHVLLEGSAA